MSYLHIHTINKDCSCIFVCLSKTCTVYYRTSNYRDAKTEKTLAWDDKSLNIKWPIKKPLLSKKDKIGMSLINLKKEL